MTDATLLMSLLATAPATGGTPVPQWFAALTTFTPVILIGLLFYLILIAPQRRKQKQTQAMINAVEKGDRVTTIGGILGTVTNVTDDTVTVKVDESTNTKIKFQKTALAAVEPRASASAASATAAAVSSSATSSSATPAKA